MINKRKTVSSCMKFSPFQCLKAVLKKLKLFIYCTSSIWKLLSIAYREDFVTCSMAFTKVVVWVNVVMCKLLSECESKFNYSSKKKMFDHAVLSCKLLKILTVFHIAACI